MIEIGQEAITNASAIVADFLRRRSSGNWVDPVADEKEGRIAQISLRVLDLAVEIEDIKLRYEEIKEKGGSQ